MASMTSHFSFMRIKSWPTENSVMGLSVLFAICLHAVFLVMMIDVFKPDMIEANVSTHRVSVVERPAETKPVAQDSQKSKLETAQTKVVQENTEQAEPKELAAVSEPKPKSKPEPERKSKSKPEPERKATLKPTVAPLPIDAVNLPNSPAEPIEPIQQPIEPADNSSELPSEPPPDTAISEFSQTAAAARPTESEQVDPVVAPKFTQGSPRNPDPEYPSLARRRGWEGDVILGVHVDEQGQVTYVEILKTSDISALDFAAYTTVKNEWRFDPAQHGDQVVKGYVVVPISFRLK
jgi:protein TonB